MALDLTTDRLHIGTCYIEVFKNVLHLDATGNFSIKIML